MSRYNKDRADSIRLGIARRVRAFRCELGWTQAYAAGKLGSSEAYWRAFETAKKDFSIVRLDEIAEILGVALADLLENEMKWEYLVEHLEWNQHDTSTQDKLDQLGEEGWELVAVTGFPDCERDQYVFKRRKRATRHE